MGWDVDVHLHLLHELDATSRMGWGGDDDIPCTCTHVRCYAIGCFLHLHTYLMLRHRMFLVGLGWGGVRMMTFLALARSLHFSQTEYTITTICFRSWGCDPPQSERMCIG